jgi:hypothetical protein
MASVQTEMVITLNEETRDVLLQLIVSLDRLAQVFEQQQQREDDGLTEVIQAIAKLQGRVIA